jgi:hypothetical protein
MSEKLERQLIELIATDRIDVPISSMSGKLKRAKKKLAPAVDLSAYKDKNFEGERVYARVETEDKEKARTMSAAIDVFCKQYKRPGKVLKGIIAEKRIKSETHLYFGMNEGRRLTADDYRGVMANLGFTPASAEGLYGKLMEASRKISRSRVDGERSILVG